MMQFIKKCIQSTTIKMMIVLFTMTIVLAKGIENETINSWNNSSISGSSSTGSSNKNNHIIYQSYNHNHHYQVHGSRRTTSSSATTTTSSSNMTNDTDDVVAVHGIIVGTSMSQMPHSVCQNNNHCFNNGICIAHPFILMNITSYNSTYYYKSCQCEQMYHGDRCQHYCPLNCMNGGICYITNNNNNNNNNGDKEIDANPIYDNSNHMLKDDGYACKCYGYYTGTLCNTPYTNCGDYRTSNDTQHTNVQCYNGGICLNEPMNITTTNIVTNESIIELQYCQCPTSYTGLDCSKPIRNSHNNDHDLIHQRTGLVSFLIIFFGLLFIIFICYYFIYKYCYLIIFMKKSNMMNEYEGAICTEPYNIRDYEKNHNKKFESSRYEISQQQQQQTSLLANLYNYNPPINNNNNSTRSNSTTQPIIKTTTTTTKMPSYYNTNTITTTIHKNQNKKDEPKQQQQQTLRWKNIV